MGYLRAKVGLSELLVEKGHLVWVNRKYHERLKLFVCLFVFQALTNLHFEPYSVQRKENEAYTCTVSNKNK